MIVTARFSGDEVNFFVAHFLSTFSICPEPAQDEGGRQREKPFSLVTGDQLLAAMVFVISTASSRAAVACEPETVGSRPVLAHSMNEISRRFSGSCRSISTFSRLIRPLFFR